MTIRGHEIRVFRYELPETVLYYRDMETYHRNYRLPAVFAGDCDRDRAERSSKGSHVHRVRDPEASTLLQHVIGPPLGTRCRVSGGGELDLRLAAKTD